MIYNVFMCMHNLLTNENDRIFVRSPVPVVTHREGRYRLGQLLQCGLKAIVIQANLLLVFDASKHHKQNRESFKNIGTLD